MSSEDHESHKNDRGRWHFDLHPDVEKHSSHGALRFGSFVHPTHAILVAPNQNLAWTSRDHRKNRHLATDPKTGRPRQRANRLHKFANMRRIEYWNVSWWVAVVSNLGLLLVFSKS
jgi:hypothetical protein